jgi:hypothetical protein
LRQYRAVVQQNAGDMTMRRFPYRFAVQVAVVGTVCLMSSIARSQVYKCVDAGEKTIYSDVPCEPRSKPLQLPNEIRETPMTVSVCAQLLDERTRLAAEADRNAKRGSAENADSAKRRQALTKQYEARCAGISRSVPTGK